MAEVENKPLQQSTKQKKQNIKNQECQSRTKELIHACLADNLTNSSYHHVVHLW